MDDKQFETCRWYADRLRGRHVTSGPWWSIVCRYVPLFDEVVRLRSEIDRLNAELANLKKNLSKETIRWFAERSGFIMVWESWRDNMLKQGRNVPEIRMNKETLPANDIELDTEIAFDVIDDFAFWALSHPHPEPPEVSK